MTFSEQERYELWRHTHGFDRTAAIADEPELPDVPEFGHQLPNAPGPMKDSFWGGGGCGQLALAFKNMWPDLKIGADVDNRDGTINHAWVHDGKRAHDFMGTHPDPHGPSGAFSNFTHHEDMDPHELAAMYQGGLNWSPDEPWGDDSVTDAAGEIEAHWLNRHYNSETGDYESHPGHYDPQPDDDDDDWSYAGGFPRQARWHAHGFDKHAMPTYLLTPKGVHNASRWFTGMGARGPLPEGLQFEHGKTYHGQQAVNAFHEDKHVGQLTWYKGESDHPMDHEISYISTHPDYRRRGVGQAMVDWGRANIDPLLEHSPHVTPSGKGFAKADGFKPKLFNGKPSKFEMDPVRDDTAEWPDATVGNGSKWDEDFWKGKSKDRFARWYTAGWDDEADDYDQRRAEEDAMWDDYDDDPFAGSRMMEHYKGDPDVEGQARHDAMGSGFGSTEDDAHDELADEKNKNWATYENMKPPKDYGRNGARPPMTMEPISTMNGNGIMARHAADGRPIGHLMWSPHHGEIKSVNAHPDFGGRGVANAMLHHARSNPDLYHSGDNPIHHSKILSPHGEAWARSDPYHTMPKNFTSTLLEYGQGGDDPYGTYVDGPHGNGHDYIPAKVPYQGQTEDYMKAQGIIGKAPKLYGKMGTPPRQYVPPGQGHLGDHWGSKATTMDWGKTL